MQHNLKVHGYEYDFDIISITYFNSLHDDDVSEQIELEVYKLDSYLTQKGFIDFHERDMDGEQTTVFSFLSAKTNYDYEEVTEILADYIYSLLIK